MLQGLFNQPLPPNDLSWLQRMAQRAQLQLARSLAPLLQLSEARTFVQEATTWAQFGIHQDFIEALFHLLPSEERYEFMQWYQNMPTGAMVPEDAVTAAASTTELATAHSEPQDVEAEEIPERASGSKDVPRHGG